MLSNFAKMLNIELLSVKPQSKAVFVNDDGRPVEAEGKTCRVVPVSLGMRCSFRDLLRYLETVEKSLPAFVTVERLRVERDKTDVLKLNILLDLNLYLLS